MSVVGDDDAILSEHDFDAPGGKVDEAELAKRRSGAGQQNPKD